MTAKITPAAEILYYRYDLRNLPSPPLERFSVSAEHQMKDDPANFLNHYQYKQVLAPTQDLTYYHSDTAGDLFLVVGHAGDYRLVIHIHDDVSWAEFRKQYETY